VHAELVNGLGIQVGRGQVALVMSRLGLRGISETRKRYVNREHLITKEDLVGRNFTAALPNQLCCTDITEHPTREGKVYCCCVLDVYSMKIAGWAIDTRQTTHLVLNALDMAV
jgi:transposase InsO family protein